jgi:hypothetical protein
LVSPTEQVVFRFAPVSTLPLAAIDGLELLVSTSGTEDIVQFSLWDWQKKEWILQSFDPQNRALLTGPAADRFIGPGFAVHVKAQILNDLDYVTIDAIELTLQGRFAG